MLKKERRALLECSWTKHFREIKRKRRGEVERKEVRKRKTEGEREGESDPCSEESSGLTKTVLR